MLTFKNWLNNYFGFTKREYNGLLTLMAILLLVSVLPYFFTMVTTDDQPIKISEQLALQKLILINERDPDQYAKIRTAIEDGAVGRQIKLFKFDPNKIDAATWQAFGLSLKQAQSIVNYRNKGGKFYKVEDLKRMYTINPQKYEELAPYVEIEDLRNKKQGAESNIKMPYIKKELVIIEINSADTLQFDEVRGIGAAFARRIVKYRNQLGGFYKKEQLMEVFGIDSLKFSEIKDQLRIDDSAIVKIDINTVGFDELKNHPYLKYKQINAIIQYRKQHGKYNSIDDLKKVTILTPQNIQNLAPYLTF